MECIVRKLYFSLFLCAFGSVYCHGERTPLYKYLIPLDGSIKRSGIPEIESMYVISTHRKDKQDDVIERTLATYGIQSNRIVFEDEAISEDEKQELSGPYPVQLSEENIRRLLRYLSLLHDAYARGFATIWIIKAEVRLSDEVAELPGLLTALSKADPEWDVFYWNGEGESAPLPHRYFPRPNQPQERAGLLQEEKPIAENIVRVYRPRNIDSILISRAGMKKIIDYFDRYHLFVPLEVDISYVPQLCQYEREKKIVSELRKESP